MSGGAGTVVEWLAMDRISCHLLLILPVLVVTIARIWTWQSLHHPSEATRGAPALTWVTEDREVFYGIEARVEFEATPGLSVEPETLLAQAWAEFDRVARVANAYDPDSEVGRLNATFKNGAYQVTSELFDLLEQSMWASRVSFGAFDATVWPLKRLWREAADRGRPPDPSETREALARVGWSRVHLSPDRHTVSFDRPDVALDFGGIAKGWAVDRVARVLESAGVRSYLVRCGGEVAALGRSPRGEPWTVGVQNPLRPGEAICVISGPGRLSVSTSGPTEQPLRVGDQLVHHILDPSTGWPAPITNLGVTVVIVGDEPKTALADALSTALSVLGPARGLDVLKSMPEAHALFLEPAEQGRLRVVLSAGFEAFCRTREP